MILKKTMLLLLEVMMPIAVKSTLPSRFCDVLMPKSLAKPPPCSISFSSMAPLSHSLKPVIVTSVPPLKRPLAAKLSEIVLSTRAKGFVCLAKVKEASASVSPKPVSRIKSGIWSSGWPQVSHAIDVLVMISVLVSPRALM